MYDSKNTNNDDDYQYHERKPFWKILFIFLGLLAVGAVAYFVFFKDLKFNDSDMINPADTTVVSKPQPIQTSEPVVFPENTTVKGNKYHIIAGAFIVEKNANSYMEELQKKGYNPQIILKRNEYNFISLFSYQTFKEANAKYKELENQGFPIWIMKYKI